MPSAVGYIWIVAPNVEPRYCTAAGGNNDGAFVRIEGDNGRRRSRFWARARFEELDQKALNLLYRRLARALFVRMTVVLCSRRIC